MNRTLRILLVFLACLQLCGGPAGLMRCVAWAGMLAAYSKQHSLKEAVEMTFDGEHPCALCHAITAVETSRPAPAQDRAPEPLTVKICKDLPTFTGAVLPAPPDDLFGVESAPESSESVWTTRGEAPPVPPPRV